MERRQSGDISTRSNQQTKKSGDRGNAAVQMYLQLRGRVCGTSLPNLLHRVGVQADTQEAMLSYKPCCRSWQANRVRAFAGRIYNIGFTLHRRYAHLLYLQSRGLHIVCIAIVGRGGGGGSSGLRLRFFFSWGVFWMVASVLVAILGYIRTGMIVHCCIYTVPVYTFVMTVEYGCYYNYQYLY